MYNVKDIKENLRIGVGENKIKGCSLSKRDSAVVFYVYFSPLFLCQPAREPERTSLLEPLLSVLTVYVWQ